MKQNRVFMTNCQLINLNMPPFALYGPTHTGRHSFATLALSYGMSIESVSKMLGHNQIRTTQIYAKVTEEKIAKEVVALKNRKKRA